MPRGKEKPGKVTQPATAGSADTAHSTPSPATTKRRGSPPASPVTPGRETETPAPAAPVLTNPGENPKPGKSRNGPDQGNLVSGKSDEKPEVSNPHFGPKPKKSPHEKRAEKKAERANWTQEQIDEAIRANGGIPKPRPTGENAAPGVNPPPAGPGPNHRPGPGRPSKYPEMDLERIEAQARGGLTKREIAWANGVCYETLRTYQKEFSAFSAAIERGRRRRVEDAERSMHLMANGFTIPEEKVQYDMAVGEWKRTTTLKVVPPDVKAQHLLLIKAETGSWAPRQEVKHTGKLSHTHAGSIQNLTDEQLDARIARLVAEAGQGSPGPALGGESPAEADA